MLTGSFAALGQTEAGRVENRAEAVTRQLPHRHGQAGGSMRNTQAGRDPYGRREAQTHPSQRPGQCPGPPGHATTVYTRSAVTSVPLPPFILNTSLKALWFWELQVVWGTDTTFQTRSCLFSS